MRTLIVIALLFSSSAYGKASIKLPNASTLKIIYESSKHFNVDAQALIKIAFLESSFNPEAKRINKNNTIDYGMFQINSVHWSTTCKEFDIFTLKGNAMCAAKMLYKAQKHASVDPHWVGRYHSKTPSKKTQYAIKVASIDIQ